MVDESLLEFNLDVDELDYYEAKHYSWEQEVEAAVAFAKELLNINGEWNKDGKPALADECSRYLENQYKEAFKWKNNIYDIPQARADFRANWDQNFLDFIKIKLWEQLKANDVISETWARVDAYNKTSNAVFGNIQAELYRFAAGVLE